MHLYTLISSLSFAALASAQGHGGVFGFTTITPAGTAAPAAQTTTPAVASNSTSANAGASTTVQGDTFCAKDVMCVNAVVNSSVVTYTLQAQGRAPGWMAMGFGTRMSGSPMVIMWANSDGSITLSQRQSSGHNDPVVTATPPRVATLQQSASVASGSKAAFVFTMPPNSDTTQKIIWAFGDKNPGSSDPGADIDQHTDNGSGSLNLAKTTTTGSGASPSAAPSASSSSSSSSDSSSGFPPLTQSQKLIIAHGVFSTLGFLVFLPFGVLLARYLRTTAVTWFQGHWIVQLLLGGGAIILGFIFGIAGVAQDGGPHFDDPHKKLGLAIVLLYILQVLLGTFIHFIKIGWAKGRPVQNYAHAVLGLLIIALAMYQIRDGFNHEWPTTMGRGPVLGGFKVVWLIWVIMLPLLYAGGMLFLKRQYRMEREAREQQHQKIGAYQVRPGYY